LINPQQKGIAERKNRNLLEVTRDIMFSMNVPIYLCGNALLTACCKNQFLARIILIIYYMHLRVFICA